MALVGPAGLCELPCLDALREKLVPDGRPAGLEVAAYNVVFVGEQPFDALAGDQGWIVLPVVGAELRGPHTGPLVELGRRRPGKERRTEMPNSRSSSRSPSA